MTEGADLGGQFSNAILFSFFFLVFSNEVKLRLFRYSSLELFVALGAQKNTSSIFF